MRHQARGRRRPAEPPSIQRAPRRPWVVTAVAVALVLLVVSCAPADQERPRALPPDAPGQGGTGPATTLPAPGPPGTADVPAVPLLLVGAGGTVTAYELSPPHLSQALLGAGTAAPANSGQGQACHLADGTGRILMADGGDPATGRPPGWTLYRLSGETVGALSLDPDGTLTRAFPVGPDAPLPYGCAVLSDGRVVTSDAGNRAAGGIVEAESCTLDSALATPLGLWVDDQDRILVPLARGPDAGVWRYSGPYPTSADAAGGCGGTDPTGLPSADRVRRAVFVPAGTAGLTNPTGLAGDDTGRLFVSSVTTGIVAEFDANGEYIRTVLRPPEGVALGPVPFATGTPVGLAIAPDGSLLLADLGLRSEGRDIAPVPGAGSIRRIAFDGTGPGPPETIASGIDGPDGVSVLPPPDVAPGASPAATRPERRRGP